MFEGPGDSGRGNRALVIGAALTALWLVVSWPLKPVGRQGV